MLALRDLLVGPLAGSNLSLDGVKARFSTPAQIIVGGRYRVTPALTLNGQVVRFTWSKFDAIRLAALSSPHRVVRVDS